MSEQAARLGLEPDLLKKLSTLPDGKFVEALDVLSSVAELPDVMRFIDVVRPRLRKLQPRRRPTLKRLLFLPVEDLFVTGAPRPGSPAIPRTTIAACWSLLERYEPQQLAALAAVLHKMPRADPRSVQPLAHQLWSVAAGGIEAAEQAETVSEPVAMIGKILAVPPSAASAYALAGLSARRRFSAVTGTARPR